MSAQNLMNSFLDTANEEAEFSTEFLLCPEIDSAPATVKKWDWQAGTYTDKNTQEEKPWAILNLQWNVDSPEAREVVKRDEVIVRQSVSLAITHDNKLDKDNNQALARLFKLFGIDPAGLTPKQIFDNFIGQYGYVKVQHRALINKAKEPLLDDEGKQRYSAEVVAVGKGE